MFLHIKDERLFFRGHIQEFSIFVLRDYVLGVFVGKGWNSTKDGVGNGLGNFLGSDYVSLIGFVVEELSHRIDQKVKKVFWWINMVEIRENRTWFLDGVCEVQGNFIIYIFLKQSGFHPWGSGFVGGVEFCKGLIHFVPGGGYRQCCCPLVLGNSNVWLKTLLKMLVNRVCGVNSIGWRVIAVGAKSNSFRRGFGGCVVKERRNVDVDEKNLRIGRFAESINIGLVSLVGCAFHEVHGVTRYGANHDFGGYCWYPGTIWVNMSYRFPNLESGNSIIRGWSILIRCLSLKIDSSWGIICRVHVHIVYETYIRVGFHGMKITWGRRG